MVLIFLLFIPAAHRHNQGLPAIFVVMA